MNRMMMEAFIDELSKMAEDNYMSMSSTGKGQNAAAGGTTGVPKAVTNTTVKPTNYSIVNTETPLAANNMAPANSKAVPPPPVRT
jgi:hypothetical protein